MEDTTLACLASAGSCGIIGLSGGLASGRTPMLVFLILGVVSGAIAFATWTQEEKPVAPEVH